MSERSERGQCTSSVKPFDDVTVHVCCILHKGHTGNHVCTIEWNEDGEIQ